MEGVIQFEKYDKAIQESVLSKEIGKVIGVSGLLMKAYVPGCGIGSVCEVYSLFWCCCWGQARYWPASCSTR